MNSTSRRDFVRLLGLSTIAAGTPAIARAQTAPRVVVVGSGFSGATVAKYLRMWSNTDVTLVNSGSSHVSCILSNEVVTGKRTLSSISFPLSVLKQKYGIKTISATVSAIDRDARKVYLKNGTILPYDRLVLAPGISFNKPNNYNMELVPHAWIAGSQTTLLQKQLAAMPSNGVFVEAIPKAPYRCPPGPYERACVVADYLKTRAGGGPLPRVILLDANPKIMAEANTFTYAFNVIHKGVIEYYPSTNGADYSVTHVNAKAKTVETPSGVFTGDVVNVIPPHRAASIVIDSGLTGAGDWAPVSALTYVSAFDPYIHVTGDSQTCGAQPKSGHAANSQAKYCADAIIRLFADQDVENDMDRAAHVVTNSACFSPITSKTAGWLTAAFRYDKADGLMKLDTNAFAEAPSINTDNYETMSAWARNLFYDTFG